MNKRIRKKKQKQQIAEAVNGLVSFAAWRERQRQAEIRRFVKQCEALYEKNRAERRDSR